MKKLFFILAFFGCFFFTKTNPELHQLRFYTATTPIVSVSCPFCGVFYYIEKCNKYWCQKCHKYFHLKKWQIVICPRFNKKIPKGFWIFSKRLV